MSQELSSESGVTRAEEGDRSSIADAYHQAFGFAAQRSDSYIRQVGLENFRVLRVGGEFAAVMAAIETAHWIGGKPVRAVNIAHVAVNPAWRGSGVAGRFLDMVCSEAVSSGSALATLFASTRPVYRRSGFSLAGVELIYEAETSAMPRVRGTGFRRLPETEAMEAMKILHREQSVEEAGVLLRGQAHWASLLTGNPSVYSSTSSAAPGYVVIDTSDPDCLVVRDWVARNGDAAAHILTLLGTFSSVYPRVRWHGSPHDALVFAMPDKGWKLVHQEEWLARVLDPDLALQQRGYRSDGELGLELTTGEGITELLLTIRDGKGFCAPPADDRPKIRVSLSNFGTLLTGHRSAGFLARAGVLTGGPAAIRMCDTLFAGPAPWVGEHF
ncbi:GNAT family N-acetyltransferase [Devosia sp. XK-2]|uniref:GNAT family N-acetyltransferase n=1 Tax=Devosia sp. XK-2 TaxID=3126689 RepID=UPI0030D1BEB5